MEINADTIINLLSYEEIKAYSQSAGKSGTILVNEVITLTVGMCNGFLRTGGYVSIADRTLVPDSLGLFIINMVIYFLLKRIPVEIELSRVASYDVAFGIMRDIGSGVFVPEGIDKLADSDSGINQPGHSNNYRQRLSTLIR